MKKSFNKLGLRGGFSLAEMLAALVIGSLILIAALRVFNRAERAADSVHRKLDGSRLPGEILQRIAEDLDRLITPGSDVKVTIANKFSHGYPSAQLMMVRTITDTKGKEQILEEIIWRSGYDVDSGIDGLVVYRSHSGITLEDKLLDDQRAAWEKGYPMVPVCAGITLFKIEVPSGDKFLDKWTSTSLPKGVVVTISFAEPVETFTGDYEVADEDKVTRTIAIDRTRKITFEMAPAEINEGLGNAGTGPI